MNLIGALLLFVAGMALFNVGAAGLRIMRNARRLPDPRDPGYEGIYVEHVVAYDPDTGDIVDIKRPNEFYYDELTRQR